VQKNTIRSLWLVLLFICAAASAPNVSLAQTGLKKVNHIIIVMQENRSFDNYFGALPYAPGTLYHSPSGNDGCGANDHSCVDRLSCQLDATGTLHCYNAHLDDNGSQVFAFHETSRCVAPDLNHSWFPTHQEANYV
jgi:phospholipase C